MVGWVGGGSGDDYCCGENLLAGVAYRGRWCRPLTTIIIILSLPPPEASPIVTTTTIPFKPGNKPTSTITIAVTTISTRPLFPTLTVGVRRKNLRDNRAICECHRSVHFSITYSCCTISAPPKAARRRGFTQDLQEKK
ncbi:hypothetical protein E2C01_061480 [Portunus trituberculatus]|uniref:Uncharacterized protein n=1 Tax=Portunus trituberculatus TaxID=210409 RepID=A0A5B7HBD7_PORTR|nr:hypothetical protein [Portunus trituberculatus]